MLPQSETGAVLGSRDAPSWKSKSGQHIPHLQPFLTCCIQLPELAIHVKTVCLNTMLASKTCGLLVLKPKKQA